ncbi:hypothetical protein [Bradyrhizobium sp. Leo121]|uniref:hypothetical protein n=1 Tax=Bradyrhizobium sp. Leo121 TaxID=1571195 RepID=UPI001029CDBD|nr:hypothetical protein [Bradyrhizobium sp. Leo121]RZN21957.1 hypothetical protein CWO90_32600 [Bradyrhizobium sp. Leo121]
MKSAEQIATDIVDQLSFSSNRMWNGRLVGEQYFAHEFIRKAVESDRHVITAPITMSDIRLVAGEGRLSQGQIVNAVNTILRQRSGQ